MDKGALVLVALNLVGFLLLGIAQDPALFINKMKALFNKEDE